MTKEPAYNASKNHERHPAIDMAYAGLQQHAKRDIHEVKNHTAPDGRKYWLVTGSQDSEPSNPNVKRMRDSVDKEMDAYGDSMGLILRGEVTSVPADSDKVGWDMNPRIPRVRDHAETAPVSGGSVPKSNVQGELFGLKGSHPTDFGSVEDPMSKNKSQVAGRITFSGQDPTPDTREDPFDPHEAETRWEDENGEQASKYYPETQTYEPRRDVDVASVNPSHQGNGLAGEMRNTGHTFTAHHFGVPLATSMTRTPDGEAYNHKLSQTKPFTMNSEETYLTNEKRSDITKQPPEPNAAKPKNPRTVTYDAHRAAIGETSRKIARRQLATHRQKKLAVEKQQAQAAQAAAGLHARNNPTLF